MTRYACILADPPWKFRDRGSRIAPDYDHRHYETMNFRDLVRLRDLVRGIAADNAHLWLWTPSAFLLDGATQYLAEQWGFLSRQIVTWCKPGIGMGHWLRNSTEHLVLCVRGRLNPLVRNLGTWFEAPRSVHSSKPVAAYELIERVSPGPRIELFARAARFGWDSWGDEAPALTRIQTQELRALARTVRAAARRLPGP